MKYLIAELHDAAHWHLIEGNGDDVTHRALNKAADALERLTAALAKANTQAEHFEREWYLRGDEMERLTAERDALREALAHIERVMGPTVPPCCEGCNYEWGEALKTVRAARKNAT